MLTRTLRMTENLVVLSLLTASAMTMLLASNRGRRRRLELDRAWPTGAAEEI